MITKETLQEQLKSLNEQAKITESNWHKLQGAIEMTGGMLKDLEEDKTSQNGEVKKIKEKVKVNQ